MLEIQSDNVSKTFDVADLQERLKVIIPDAKARIALAFSGGGDSTALIHALRDFRANTLVLIVDHGLRKDSQSEALKAQKFAQILGYEARVLQWDTDSKSGPVKTGIQEKARQARYGLLGAECRAEGIAYLITGHTKDDQAETLFMRYDRQTDWRGACGMSEIRFAPLWPELAEVTVLRPLLNITRQALRTYNLNQSLSWTEDPSNADVSYARIRARQELSQSLRLQKILLDPVRDLRRGVMAEQTRIRCWANDNMSVSEYGYVQISSPPPTELLMYILQSVGGSGGPIDRTKLKALKKCLSQKGFKAATLAGSKIELRENGFLISRDLVAVKGRRDRHTKEVRKIEEQHLGGTPIIWDGRYWMESREAGWYVKPAYKLRASLPKNLQNFLLKIPAAVRPTLPILFDTEGRAQSIGPYSNGVVLIKGLVRDRLYRKFAKST